VDQLKASANTDSRIKLRGSFPPEKRGDVYRAIDVLVLPSRVPETFSLVTHEALSVGKPVIASNIGAIPEAVIDGANGFLFEPGNIDQLTMILGRIKDNPELLEKLNCPGPVNITTDEEHINELLQIYNTILTGTPQDNEAIY
jgi:glycosyltransferase involved in cell wall biosynthesis